MSCGRRQLAGGDGTPLRAAHRAQEGATGSDARAGISMGARSVRTKDGFRWGSVRSQQARAAASAGRRSGHCLCAGDATFPLDRDAATVFRKAHADLPRAVGAFRLEAEVCHHAHPRVGPRTGQTRRCGDCGGKVQGTVAWHSLGRQGPSRHGGQNHSGIAFLRRMPRWFGGFTRRARCWSPS